MKGPDVLRYTIWAVLAVTANANRRAYRMPTTWLPHLLVNSVALLLPDALRLLSPAKRQPDNLIEGVMNEMVRDNAQYVTYVFPLAAGYILSHPKFNIFKGKMGDIRVAGLGLDAIPHSATGFALSTLVQDTLETAAALEPATASPLARLIHVFNRRPAWVSFGMLGLLTFIWEYGEYRVHYHELEQQGGDISKINMMWSADDTARDVLANYFGWVIAQVVRLKR